jgi:predicted transcriptional regulator
MASDTLVVRDVLIPLEHYPHLNENQSLFDAVQKIKEFTVGEKNRIRYAELFIVNNDNQLVGKIEIIDILHALAPSLFAADKVAKFEGKGMDFPNLAILLEDSFLKKCAEQATIAIKDFMVEIEDSVKADTPTLKTLMLMLNAKKYSFPVVDGREVIGVVRLEEIFLEICDHCKL